MTKTDMPKLVFRATHVVITEGHVECWCLREQDAIDVADARHRDSGRVSELQIVHQQGGRTFWRTWPD